jgi:hypothetical protein
MPVKIAGIGKCLPGTDVPGRVVTNEEIVKILLDHGAIKPGTDRPWTAEELTPQKVLSLDYIQHQFQTYPRAVVTPLLNLLTRCAGARLRHWPLSFRLGEMMVAGTKD